MDLGVLLFVLFHAGLRSSVDVFVLCSLYLDRVRRMNDVYFEFLIPETVPDARQRDPPLKVAGAEDFQI